MVSASLAAAFGSGLGWAGLDIARKSLARDVSPAVVAAGLSLGLVPLFGGWALLQPSPVDVAAYLGPASISVALGLAIQVLVVASVQRAELSRTIPLLSVTPVATTLFGVALLGERPTPIQWLGIGLVFVGALGLGVGRRRFRFDRGAILMLAAALCISAAAPFDKLAVAASSPANHGFFQSAGSGVLLVVYLLLRGEAGRVATAFRRRPALAGAALLTLAALGFQFIAYQGAMVGIVETIKRAVGMLSSLVAGSLVFGERIGVGRIVTVVSMGAGTVLILR